MIERDCCWGNLCCSVRLSNWVLHYQSQIPEAHKAGIIPPSGCLREEVEGVRCFSHELFIPVSPCPPNFPAALRSARLCWMCFPLQADTRQHSDFIILARPNTRTRHLRNGYVRRFSLWANEDHTHTQKFFYKRIIHIK